MIVVSPITNGNDQSLTAGPHLEVVGGCFEDPSGGWGGARMGREMTLK